MSRPDARHGSPWPWIGLGLGSGLVLALLLGFGVRTFRRGGPPDPRARQVEELLEEAERLLAQGRRSAIPRPGRP